MTTIRAGVIGYPVKHSKSPLIHRHWLETYRIDGDYTAIEIAPDRLAEKIHALAAEGFAGFNVTVPHKQAVMALCDHVDDTARAIGAVNTVKIENGVLSGTNTDAYGFIENIKRAAPSFSYVNGPAVVLGAGGAARAVIYGLLQEGVPDIRLTNRTQARAEELREMAPGRIAVVPWEEKEDALAGAALLVNTTALGMTGQPPLDIGLEKLPRDALVTDIVYAPLTTDLLAAAAARGNPVVTGIGMLLHQARAGFELWFGVLPDVTEALERKVLA